MLSTEIIQKKKKNSQCYLSRNKESIKWVIHTAFFGKDIYYTMFQFFKFSILYFRNKSDSDNAENDNLFNLALVDRIF